MSVMWSVDPVLTIRRLFLFSMLLFSALGLCRILSNRSFVVVVFLCTTLFLLIGVFVELRFNSLAPLVQGYRFSGTIHPNLQGVNCALQFLSGAVLFRLSKHHRIAIALAMAGGFFFLVITRSRASFGALIFAFVFYALLTSSMPRKIVYTLLIIITVGLLALSSSAVEVLLDEVILMGRSEDTTETLVGRVPLWEDCLAYASDRPILGYGFCTFWTESIVQRFEASHGWAPKSAHSVYIEVLLSVGLIGSTLFFLSVFFGTRLTFLRGTKQENRDEIFLFYVLIFGLFHGILESTVLFANFQDFSTFVALNTMMRMGSRIEISRFQSTKMQFESPSSGI